MLPGLGELRIWSRGAVLSPKDSPSNAQETVRYCLYFCTRSPKKDKYQRMLGIGDQRKHQDRGCTIKLSLEDTGQVICSQEGLCEPSTWGFRSGGEGRLKKKEEKGTERGKEHVGVILSDQHGCFVSMCAYLPWSSSKTNAVEQRTSLWPQSSLWY